MHKFPSVSYDYKSLNSKLFSYSLLEEGPILSVSKSSFCTSSLSWCSSFSHTLNYWLFEKDDYGIYTKYKISVRLKDKYLRKKVLFAFEQIVDTLLEI